MLFVFLKQPSYPIWIQKIKSGNVPAVRKMRSLGWALRKPTMNVPKTLCAARCSTDGKNIFRFLIPLWLKRSRTAWDGSDNFRLECDSGIDHCRWSSLFQYSFQIIQTSSRMWKLTSFYRSYTWNVHDAWKRCETLLVRENDFLLRGRSSKTFSDE